MALNSIGLGKGLDALIRETAHEKAESAPDRLPLSSIAPNPDQPRRHFEEGALLELAASIKNQGLLQPILVRPSTKPGGKYEIIAGERRWRASKMAGLMDAPVIVRTFSDQETLVAALAENMQREDLNPLEEALGISALKEEFGLNQEELAHLLGKSRSAIANSLRLLTLPESMRAEIASGALSAGHARALLSLGDESAQNELKLRILEGALSVRDAEGLATFWKDTGSFSLSAAKEGIFSINAQSSTGTLKKSRTKKPQSQTMLEAQEKLSDAFDGVAKISGTASKGKVTIAFGSQEDLARLLLRLGV